MNILSMSFLVALASAGAVRDTPCPLVQPRWAGNIGPAVSVRSLFVGPDGRVMLAGRINLFPFSVDLDPTEGVAEFAATGPGNDGFLTVLNPDGGYAWTSVQKAPAGAVSRGISVDPEGNVVLATNRGVDPGEPSVRISWLTHEGVPFRIIDFASASSNHAGNGGNAMDLVVARNGIVYVSGTFAGTVDFDPSASTDFHTSTPIFSFFSADPFVTKLNADGSYAWTRTFGGSGFDTGVGVATDPDGNVVVTGTFVGTVDFDPGPGVDIHVQQGFIEDSFVTKFYANGDYGWTRTYPLRFLAGKGKPAVDRHGNVLFTHSFGGTMDFNPDGPGGEHKANGDSGDLIVVKLAPDGGYIWSFSTSDGAGIEIGQSVAVGDNDDVFVLGELRGASDFDPGSGETLLATTAPKNAVLLKLNADGEFVSAHAIGGANFMEPKFVGIAPGNQPVVLGRFASLEGPFDADPSCEATAIQAHDEEAWDVLIARYACVEPTADLNGDGFVELKEFARMSWCLTGPALAPGDDGDEPIEPIVCHPGCATQDLDADGDLDLLDLALFANAFTGPP